jgi:hypothetical protein
MCRLTPIQYQEIKRCWRMCKVYSSEPYTPRRLSVLVKRNQILIHPLFSLLSRSRDTSVSIADWMAGFQFPAGTRDCSLPYSVWNPPSLLSNGYRGFGVKRPGREADHSPPSSAEVRNGGAIPPLPIRLREILVHLPCLSTCPV